MQHWHINCTEHRSCSCCQNIALQKILTGNWRGFIYSPTSIFTRMWSLAGVKFRPWVLVTIMRKLLSLLWVPLPSSGGVWPIEMCSSETLVDWPSQPKSPRGENQSGSSVASRAPNIPSLSRLSHSLSHLSRGENLSSQCLQLDASQKTLREGRNRRQPNLS